MRRPGDLIIKDPDSVEPQGMDWTAWLAEISVSETVASSTWTVVSPTGDLTPITKSGETISADGRRTQLTLSGGTLGLKYTITNHIVTSSGIPADDRSFKVLVVQR